MAKQTEAVRKKLLEKRPLDHNFAADQDFANATMSMLVDMWKVLWRERREREERWKESYRAWTVDDTEADSLYLGRANMNLPQIRKEVETMTRRLMKGLFPTNFLDAIPGRLENEDLAEVNGQVTEHYIANVMKMKTQMTPWVKQGVIYGTSPIRTFWRTDVNEQFFRERFFVNGKDGILEPKFRKVRRPVVSYDAPYSRAEDIFNVWVHPFNVSSVRDIQMVFYRTKIQRDELLLKVKEGAALAEIVNEIKDTEKTSDLEFEQQQEKFQQFGTSGEIVNPKGRGTFDLLEIWGNIVLPGETLPVPVVVEIINGSHVTRIQRNPYWHQRAPFDFMRFIVPPAGEFYGRGLPEATIRLQHQLNATLNQTVDSGSLSLNNVTIVNPAFAPNAESFEVEPGAVWWADPAAVKQFQFPDLTASGMTNVGVLRQAISEMSDNSPQLPDPLAGKARSTGQAELAFGEFQTDLLSFMDTITTEALNPFAKKVHIMLQQYLPEDRIIRVAGRNSPNWIDRAVTPEELVGDFDFEWKGAIQIANQSVKGQQLLNFMRLFPQLPPDSNVRIRWANLLRVFFKDSLQMRDADFMIETTQQGASTPARIENRIIAQGGMIEVQPTDDDSVHIQSHQSKIGDLKSNWTIAKMQEHINAHVKQIKDKELAIQQQQLEMQLALAQAQPPGGAPTQQGNPQQISESPEGADQQRGLRG
jgi:hypothetical protein